MRPLSFLPLLLLCAAACSGKEGPLRSFELKYGGYTRTYLLYVPANLAKDKKYPLMVILHGGGGTGKGMRKITGYCFERRSEKYGGLVAYPQGVDKNWNDHRGDKSRTAQRENIDDAAFLSAMADEISAKYPVDPSRVYAAGMSNGAMLSYTLACRSAGKFAAIAAVAGSMPENLAASCKPSRPVPVLMINGTKDKLVHWEGGEVTGPFGRRKFGRVIPVEKTRDFWLKNDSCAGLPVVTTRDEVPDDGTIIERETYSGCAEGSAVDLIKVVGGGHTWPGGAPYLPEFVIGKNSEEIAASDEIWDFFMEHPMPAERRGRF